MAKRRRVLMGLGALVFGSGAMSVNAAFSNSVNATGDLRVVVEDDLLVEPGIMFRDGTNPTDPVDPPNAGTPSGTGPNGENIYDQTSNDLFGGTGNDGLSNNVSGADMPAASINDDVNGNIYLEVGVEPETDDQLGNGTDGVLQVRNETSSDQDVAIRYTTFGSDASSNGGDVDESDIFDILQFNDSSDNRISPNATGSPQTVDNTVTVGAGTTEQLYIDYNTNTASGDIDSAASTGGGSPFSGNTDTVQLVEEITVGIDPDSGNVS